MAHQDSKPHDEKVQQIQNSLVNFFSTFDDDIDNINQHNQIQNVLINKYGWKNSSFSTGITVDGVLALVRDIEYIRNNGKIMKNEDDHHQQQNDSNRGTGELDDETYMSVDEEDLQTCEVILFNILNYSSFGLIFDKFFIINIRIRILREPYLKILQTSPY